MKRTLLKTLLLACLLSVWGANCYAAEVYTINLSSLSRPSGFPSDGSSSSATVEFSATDESTAHTATWSITQTSATSGSYYWAWDSSAGVHMGSSSVHCTGAVVTSTSFTSYAVNKVTVSARENSNTVTNISVKVGDTSFLCNGSETATISTTLTDYVFENSTGVNGTLEITYVVSSGTAVYFNGVVIEDAGEDKSPHLAYSESYVGYYTDEVYTAVFPELTYAEGFTALDEIKYSSEDTSVATVDTDGKVTLTGTKGSTTIHATFEGNDSYDASSASYEIMVGDPHTFNFNVKRYGMTVQTGNNDYETTVTNITGTDNVAIGFTGNYRLWESTNEGVHLRINKDATLTISAPSGRTIEQIIITSTGNSDNMSSSNPSSDPSGSSYSNHVLTWTGSAESVTFTFSSTTHLYYIDVTLSAPTTGSFTITEAGYATYYTDYEYTMPEGVTGTTVTGVGSPTSDGGYYLTTPWEYGAGTTVPAKTALVLEGNEGTYTYAITSTDAAASTSNLLLGSTTDTPTTGPNGETTGYVFYELTNGSSGIGFYYGADGGEAFTSAANKAWLALTTEQARGAKFLGFGDGDTTGITSVENEAKTVKGIYTLQGVKVSNMSQPGLYIVDGKKVIKR